MEILLISPRDLMYYTIIIFCLFLIAFILLKYWNIKKEEKEEIVVKKISEPKKEEVKEEAISSDLEDVLAKMQNDLDNGRDVTQMFEEEQEEKAIISYQELVRANLKNELPKEQSREEIPIDNEIPIINEESSIENTKKETKKFKQTDFISPIYGTMDVKSIPKKNPIDDIKDIDIEKTLNLTGLSAEKKKNDEFLKSLKEFRNSL